MLTHYYKRRAEKLAENIIEYCQIMGIDPNGYVIHNYITTGYKALFIQEYYILEITLNGYWYVSTKVPFFGTLNPLKMFYNIDDYTPTFHKLKCCSNLKDILRIVKGNLNN